jgi:type I restriction enzyme M protein
MSIYLLFIQHIIYSLSSKGKAAVVVPTGFITGATSIEKKIKKYLIEHKYLKGVISMPSNIFASTGTNVSILFIDKSTKNDEPILIDAANLGTSIKEGKNQKTVLSTDEEKRIINAFKNKSMQENFSITVDCSMIIKKNYSLSAGQYFDLKVEYTDITYDEFKKKINNFIDNLGVFHKDSRNIESKIKDQLKLLKYEQMEKK